MRLPLRTQLVVVLACVQLYSLGVGLAYWVQHRAHARLEDSFRRELVMLSQLPRLRDRVRRLDLGTDSYLMTGSAPRLKERQESLQEIRKGVSELSALAVEPAERELFHQLDRELTVALAQQAQWVSLKRTGRLSTAGAARVIKLEKAFARTTELLGSLKDANLETLERQRRAARRAGAATLWIILAAGLGAGAGIVYFLSHYLVWPIRALQRYAVSWKLGRAWDVERPPASPELEELFGTLKEMTTRLNAQYEKEQELGRLKTRLVSMVSHEFNNALSVLGGAATLLQKGDASSAEEKRAGYYAMIQANIRTLSLAASNMLNMGRLESGKFAVAPRRMDAAALVKETLERLRLLCERKGLSAALEVPGGPLEVRADPEALTLVVTNLLGNAIKYTPENGRVTIGAERTPAGIRVFVTDTGIGIPREEQERVFSDYYRTEAGQKAAKGFGVGLSVANSLLEAHDSSLTVESEPGKGSTFAFLLPAWEEGVT